MKTPLIILLSLTLLLCGCSERNLKAEVDALLDCEKQATESNKDICYDSAAIIKKDIALCGRISSEGLRDNCYHKAAAIKEDEAVCNRITSSGTKDLCLYEIALNKNISAICGNIEKKELREECAEELVIRKANISMCEVKNTPTEKDLCYKRMAEAQRNVTICNRMEENDYECYATIAQRLDEPGICERIELWDKREACYLNIAKLTDDNKLCLKLTGSDQWALCMAYTKKDYKKCDLVLEYRLGRMCYTEVAVLTGNADICKKNSDTYLIDCYQSVAIAKKDITVCDLITGDENKMAKNQCKMWAGQFLYSENEWKT